MLYLVQKLHLKIPELNRGFTGKIIERLMGDCPLLRYQRLNQQDVCMLSTNTK
jgi:hypothetical protein